MSKRDRVPAEARGILRAPGYMFQEGQPRLRLEWRQNDPVTVEGFNADGDDPEIRLTGVMGLEIPRSRLELLARGKPNSESENAWLAGFTDSIRQDLNNALAHAFTLLRWRSAAAGPEDYKSIRHDWREVGGEWRELPGAFCQFMVRPRADIGRLHEVAPAIQEMLEHGIREPVAHQLLREAAALAKDGRRSRAPLVLAAAAVEVAVKDLIAYLAPKTEWLVQNVPSPPVTKLMKEYIPELLGDDGPDPAFDPDLIDSIEKMTRERNETVHTGAEPLPLERLSRRIHATEDVIWRCDELAGHEWASERVGIHRIAGLAVSGPERTIRLAGSVLDSPEMAARMNAAEEEEEAPDGVRGAEAD